jgi:hypothetical protein
VRLPRTATYTKAHAEQVSRFCICIDKPISLSAILHASWLCMGAQDSKRQADFCAIKTDFTKI